MSIKSFRERSPILIGILSIIGVAAGTTGAFYIERLPFVKQSYKVTAEFENASGLQKENQIRVAGIKVGTVESVELDGTKVVVTMDIENGTEIPKDADAAIKLATLLGTKFIDIEAKGGEPFLEEGDVIPIERTTVPYEIFQAANEGTGVIEQLDGDALNDMLVKLTDVLALTRGELGNALEGLNELGGQLNSREDDFRGLLAGSNQLTKLLADEGDTLVRLIDASNEVLGSLGRKREDIQALLESTKLMAGELTDVIRSNRGHVDTILTDLNHALTILEKNVQHLDIALKYVGPSSKYFAQVFRQGRWGDIYTCALVGTGTCETDEGTP